MLRPSLTLFDIFGPAHAYVPRADDRAADWLPPLALDLMTGGQLAVAGAMPVVCSAGFTTGAASDLLGLAGLQMGSRAVPFTTGGSLAAVESLDPSFRLVLQHALPAGQPLAGRSWIDHDLLVRLNNKANLADMAPPGHVPERMVVERADFFRSLNRPPPFVVKAVTDQSTGGGFGVQLCHTLDDACSAATRFGSLDRIVIEELLELVTAPCLNFVIHPAGTITYLGHSDQIVSPEGRHMGNWVEQDAFLPSPAVDIASGIVRKAASMGYRGIAGIDMALTGDGRLLVLDLNFRTNASTAALLLAPAIAAAHGRKVLLSWRFEGSGNAPEFARALVPFVRDTQLVPLALFDPLATGQAGAAPSVLALIAAATRDEAQRIANVIRSLG